MTDQQALTSAIKICLAPALRADGFAGSGRQYRRIIGDFIHVVWVQVWNSGGSFCINLGLQPANIPDALWNEPEPKKIHEGSCRFRRRLTDGEEDQWWSYKSPDEIIGAVERATETYQRYGRRVFAEQSGPNAPLRTMTPEELEAGSFDLSGFRSTDVSLALALCQMRLASSQKPEARSFGLLGLKYLGTDGIHKWKVKLELETLIARASN